MTTNINVMHWGKEGMEALPRAVLWRRTIERIRHEATKPRQFPVRAATILTAALTLCTAALVFATPYMTPRHFALSSNQRTLESTTLQPLRAAGDWVNQHKYAMLTFDDGPNGNALDDRILAVLRQHHAHAMFFVVCGKMNDETVQAMTKMEREGHAIGNHSFDHAKLSTLTAAQLPHEIEDCSRQIAQVTGHRPRYFRPPFGMTNDAVRHAAEQAGMKQMLWDANSYDCLLKNPAEIVRHATNETFDTSIILMHEKETTAAALDQILTNLENRGFEFVLPDDAMPSGEAG